MEIMISLNYTLNSIFQKLYQFTFFKLGKEFKTKQYFLQLSVLTLQA